MRTKREFIQAAVLAWLPHHGWDLAKTLRWADRAWDALTEHGHGPVRADTRITTDWYARLPPEQRPYFDRFFSAFARKGDSRQKAAQSWHRLSPAPDLAEIIIRAAAAEAALPRARDEVRKMAQGWLSEERWTSHIAPAASPADTHADTLRELRAEVRTLRTLAAADRSGTIAAQIAALETQIAALCQTSPPPPSA